MKKSLLALAIGFLASSAFAQSSVTVYGVADAGIVKDSGNGANTTKVSSGVASESRLGFKGSEDLGNGTKAVFTLEAGVNLDTGTSSQSGTAFGRQAFVGLSNTAYGTLTAGRQQTSLYNTLANVADPFKVGLAGSTLNLFSTGGDGTNSTSNHSLNNSVKYETPSFAGFSGDVIYGFGEVPGSVKAARTTGGSVGYADKAANVRVAYSKSENPFASDSLRTTLVAGSYDLGYVKAHAAYATNKGSSDFSADVDSRDMLIGASAPVGPGKLMVSYIRKDDRSVLSQDANQIGIGYTYDLSKRTDVYTSYARISNKNGASYTVGNASEAGSSDRSFNVGMRHSF
jgi:predicted porin